MSLTESGCELKVDDDLRGSEAGIRVARRRARISGGEWRTMRFKRVRTGRTFDSTSAPVDEVSAALSVDTRRRTTGRKSDLFGRSLFASSGLESKGKLSRAFIR